MCNNIFMFNKNKKSLILPILVISLAIGFLFHEKITIGPLSLSSLSSVNQILSAYNDEQRIRSMSMSEREDLNRNINTEKSAIIVAMQPLRTKIQNLIAEKSALSTTAQTLRQKDNLLLNQTQAQRNKISGIENQIAIITNQYNNQIQQCNRLKGVLKTTCLNRAVAIKKPIDGYKTDLASAKKILTTLNTNLSTAKKLTAAADENVNKKQKEIDVENTNVSIYENQITQLGQILIMIEEANRVRDTPGCMGLTAKNFNSTATVDDGSCVYTILGCMDPRAVNYDYTANEDNATCFYEDRPESCLCSDNPTAEEEEVLKPTSVFVIITGFGGAKDTNIPLTGPGSTGGVAGNHLRSLPDDDIYTAWPMPGINKDTEGSLQLPNIEKCFAADKKTNAEINEDVNKTLADYTAEISWVDPGGNKHTVSNVRIEDRGPGNSGRWDASMGMWRALGMGHLLDEDFHNPSDPNQRVTLEVRLVPKASACPNSN